MPWVRGVRLIDLARHRDSRGSLLAFGGNPQLPFPVKNVYFILDCPPGAIRAEHATSANTAIIALNPAITVDLDNGSEQESQRLTRPDTALIIKAGVWMRLREFARETKVVVLSSKPFREMRQFQGPQPTLLDDVEP